MAQCLRVKSAKMRQRAVRIGVGLKIDDKTLADPLMGKQRQAGLNLVGDRRMVRRFDGKLAAAARRTENAAAAAQSAVTVGTGEPRIDGNLVQLFSVCIFQEGVQRIVGSAVPLHRCLLPAPTRTSGAD